MVSGFWANAKGLSRAAPSASRDLRVSRRLNCWLMVFSSERVDEIEKHDSCKKRDMRGHHAPALRRAQPGLRLAATALLPLAAEFDVRGREVAPERGDHAPEQFARESLRRPRRTEGADRLVAIQVLGHAVAQRVRTVPEQFVEHGDVVGDERLLVTLELRRDF